MTLQFEVPSLDSVTKILAAYRENDQMHRFLMLQSEAHNSHCAVQQRITSQAGSAILAQSLGRT
jgi:hypothetical protein